MTDPASRVITDPDVKMLAGIAATLASDYVDPTVDPWAGSPFAWIRTRPSRQRGKIGEQLVAGWAAAKGLSVGAARGSDADRIINGRLVEIKFSTLWEKGDYVFQQIRDQNYELALFLGLSPFAASCWVLPKKVLIGSTELGMRGQHTGRSAVDTSWLRFPAHKPPPWMAAYGGTLADAFRALAA